MSDYFYEPLSLTDYSFLVQETAELHMSVIGVTIFEAGPLRLADGGIDFGLDLLILADQIDHLNRLHHNASR